MLINKILLDTHVWIWLMNGDATLSQKSQQLIENARNQGNLFVAAISVWEIGMLNQKQRIILNKPCIDWIQTALQHGIQLIELSPEIAIESCQLPEYPAGSPADRMIIATARIKSLKLLTRNENILAYSLKNLVSALKA